MQTALSPAIRETDLGRRADAVLRACVHCGFCNATCPTYQLLGDELDGPRGRIYQIKQVLEGEVPTHSHQLHLDRCLTCRNCETTCPSGVRYGELLDIGRELIEAKVPRSWRERVMRRALCWVIPYKGRFGALLRIGQIARPFLPTALKQRIPPPATVVHGPRGEHLRRMLVLDGCVQPALAPQINAAAARVLSALGIGLVSAPKAGCCGALSFHLTVVEEAREFARRNIDAWWPYVNDGIEAIVMTASGCGVHVKQYGELLADDPDYAKKADRIGELTRDIAEIVAREDLSVFKRSENAARKIVFHSPCTLQHGQKLNGVVEKILADLGFILTPVADAHLCCGSAGTYSILQPALAGELRRRKLAALTENAPELVATANIGCLAHLAASSSVPVRHWIELL